jgi:hypothetical protein
MAMTHDPTDVTDRAPTRPLTGVGPNGRVASDQPTIIPDPPDVQAPPAGATTLSWAEREVLGALRRLARAQANLAAAEAQGEAADAATFDPVDVERLEEVHVELAAARAKASGRFTKGAARQRVRDLETTERLVLGRLGVDGYDDYRAQAAARVHHQVVETEVIDFARRELASAQQAWREVQALEVDERDASVFDARPDVTAAPDIDLTALDPS